MERKLIYLQKIAIKISMKTVRELLISRMRTRLISATVVISKR
jgi:hypothetical protein